MTWASDGPASSHSWSKMGAVLPAWLEGRHHGKGEASRESLLINLSNHFSTGEWISWAFCSHDDMSACLSLTPLSGPRLGEARTRALSILGDLRHWKSSLIGAELQMMDDTLSCKAHQGSKVILWVATP